MTRAVSPETLVDGLVACVDPRTSPDGRRIVDGVSRAEWEAAKVSAQHWQSDVDGENARRLTRSGQSNSGARWSPDGSDIAFVSDRPVDSQQGVFVMASDGGEARELTGNRGEIANLAWAPDGRTIAYSAPLDPANPSADPPASKAPRARATRRIDYRQDNRENGGDLGDVRR